MVLDKRFQSEAIVTHGGEGAIPEDVGRKDARPGWGALTRDLCFNQVCAMVLLHFL